jgi:hypothetical protein
MDVLADLQSVWPPLRPEAPEVTVRTQGQSKMMHINYAPVLKSVPLKSAPEIYLVQGKAAAGQLAVSALSRARRATRVRKETVRAARPIG